MRFGGLIRNEFSLHKNYWLTVAVSKHKKATLETLKCVKKQGLKCSTCSISAYKVGICKCIILHNTPEFSIPIQSILVLG